MSLKYNVRLVNYVVLFKYAQVAFHRRYTAWLSSSNNSPCNCVLMVGCLYGPIYFDSSMEVCLFWCLNVDWVVVVVSSFVGVIS